MSRSVNLLVVSRSSSRWRVCVGVRILFGTFRLCGTSVLLVMSKSMFMSG